MRVATFQACDEVANVGLGKFAFIGIYGADLLVPVLPFTLPQLFFVVRFRTAIDDPAKKLKIRIERPGHHPFEVDNTAQIATPPTPGAEAKFFQSQSIVRIAPLEIKEIGTIKVFVEDEHGDNYAGGLRVRVGIHPDMSTPQLALSASLVAAHYQRLSEYPQNIRHLAAAELIEAMSAFMKHSGVAPKLQFPDTDVRFLLDDKRAHVFFAKPLKTPAPKITIEHGGNFDEGEVETANQLGFVAKFEPSAPAVLMFNYSVSESPAKPGLKKTKRQPRQSKSTPN